MAATSTTRTVSRHRPTIPPDRNLVLGVIIAFNVVSTALHYTHNYLQIEHYPPADFATNHTIQIAILISWPVLTVVGVLGLWLYHRGLRPVAYACLIAYSTLGLATLGHFTEGSPHIPVFWYATIFTDALGGLAVLAFIAWSLLTSDQAAARR